VLDYGETQVVPAVTRASLENAICFVLVDRPRVAAIRLRPGNDSPRDEATVTPQGAIAAPPCMPTLRTEAPRTDRQVVMPVLPRSSFAPHRLKCCCTSALPSTPISCVADCRRRNPESPRYLSTAKTAVIPEGSCLLPIESLRWRHIGSLSARSDAARGDIRFWPLATATRLLSRN